MSYNYNRNIYENETGGSFETIKKVGKAVLNPIKTITNLSKGIRMDYSPPAREFLAKNGDKTIRRLTLFKHPIPTWVEKLFEWVSLGVWEQKKKEHGFDEFYHLGIIVEFGDGEEIVIEKNEVIQFNKLPTHPETKIKEVNLNFLITINEWLEKTRKRMGTDKFFRYDSFTNNCQVFVKNLLESVDKYNEENKEFVFQNIYRLFTDLPKRIDRLASGTTNFAAMADIAIHGRGLVNHNGKQNFYITADEKNSLIPIRHRRDKLTVLP